MTDETGKIQQLLRAKSGRAVGGDATSNLGEASAVADTQAQLGQQAQAIGIQSHQTDIAAQRQANETASQQAQVAQAKKFDTAENKIKTSQLLSGLARDRDTLDLDKDKARLEQTSFLLAMQDKKYINDIQDIGKKNRLDDAAAFKEAQQKLVLGASTDLLKQQLGAQDLLSVSDQEFRKAMSEMTIDQIMKLTQLEMEDAKNAADTSMSLEKYKSSQAALASGLQAQSQGLQSLIQGGTQAYAAGAGGSTTTASTTNNVGSGSTFGTENIS